MMFSGDTMQHVKNSDLIQVSRTLLESVMNSTDLINTKTMTPQKLQEAKVVLGYLNAAHKTIQTRMQYARMIGMDEKIKAIQKASKKIK